MDPLREFPAERVPEYGVGPIEIVRARLNLHCRVIARRHGVKMDVPSLVLLRRRTSLGGRMRRCWTKRLGSTHIRILAWRMRGSGRAHDPIRAWVRRCGTAWRLRGQPGCADWMRPPDQVARRPPGIERVRRGRCGVFS